MYDKILVPVDGSAPATRALLELQRIATDRKREVALIHVVDMPHWDDEPEQGTVGATLWASFMDEGRAVLAAAKALLAAQGIVASEVLAQAQGERAAVHIVRHAQQWSADLIVMGTRGRRGISRFVLGSDAAEVVRTASMPVLLVHGDD